MANSAPERVVKLFRDAIRQPANIRVDFLRAACGSDEALFAQVVGLLDADPGSTGAVRPGSEPTLHPAPSSPSTEFRGTDRFVLKRRIGSGSFGVVYEVQDLVKDASLALKTLQNVTSESLYRFKREFRSLADVSHRNLVQLYELGSDGDHWFFTMELVHGQHFLEHVCGGRVAQDHRGISTGGSKIAPVPAAVGRLVPALSQLVQGLDALHRSGHLHRDVKPANVLVTPDDRVVLLDFGLVADVKGEATQQSVLIAGTPIYMSPEQAAGLPLSAASDWYSVGVMLYEALTGTPPFRGTYLEVLTEKQRAEPELPSSRVAGVSDALDVLCRDLLKRDARERPSVDVILDRLEALEGKANSGPRRQLARERSQLFVGRRSHLSTLNEAFRQMQAGTPMLVSISGPSGIGKSALVRAFLDAIRRSHPDAVILSGRCYERESVPYKALDSLVDSLARYLKHLPNHEIDVVLPREMGSIAQLFPLLGEFRGRSPQRGAEPRDAQELRRRAYASLRELLARLGDRHPLVISIDDLQWGDVDSAGLLTELLRLPDAPVLLLLATYRDVEMETSPFMRSFLTDELACRPDFRAIRVDPLGAREAQELAAALLRSSVAGAPAIATAIASESGGSPFFIDELVRFAETAEAGIAGTGVPSRAADTDAREATLAHMIQLRLLRLPTGAQRLLQVAAVNGRPVPESVLVSAADVSAPESALALLRAEHLLRARETERGVELEPYHDRIRELVVRSLDPGELRECHRRLATAFQHPGSADPELLGEHFFGAGDIPRAAEHLLIAGQQAEQALAFDRAARLYRRTLTLLPPASDQFASCMAKHGRALTNAGRCAEAAAVYLAVPTSTAAEAIDFKQKAAQQLLFAGHVEEGLAVVGEVLGSIGMTLPQGRWQTLAALIVGRLRVRIRGLRYAERATTPASSDELMKVDACWSVSAGLGVVDTMRGAVFQTRHLLLALRAGELARVHRALCMEAMFAATAGVRTIGRVHRIRSKSRDLTAKVGTPYARAMQLLSEGVSAYLVGNWKPAAASIVDAERLLTNDCTGVTWELDCARFFGLYALYQLGELKTIVARLPVLLKDAHDRGDLYASTTIGGFFAHLTYLATDDPLGASRHTVEAIRHWAQRDFHMPHVWELWSSADIAMYEGRGLDAYTQVRDTWPALDHSLLLNVQFMRISMLDLKGRAALSAATEAARASDRERFCLVARKCARTMEQQRVEWAAGLALMLRAGVHQLRLEPAAAVAALGRAHETFRARDMNLLAAVARRRRGEMTGGGQGTAHITEADAWMRAQDIREPASFTRIFAPAGG